MQSPLVTEAYQERLATVMTWHRDARPGFRWGVVLHRRDERGRARFGAVTAGGESLLLTVPLLEALDEAGCWLDGALPVRLASCAVVAPPMAGGVPRPTRAPLVAALAIGFGAQAGPDEGLLAAMGGELTPDALPGELFLLARERPARWPR